MSGEIYDKERLVVDDRLLTWKHSLEGTEISIQRYPKHQNLQFFTTIKNLSHRLARWAAKIRSYRFRIDLKPGVNNDKPGSMAKRREFDMEVRVR